MSHGVFDIPSRMVSSPSISVDSSDSGVPRKKHFDDRTRTQISISLRAHEAEASPIPNYKPTNSYKDILRWSETTQLNHIINSPGFISSYGHVNFLDVSSLYLVVGTTNGSVIGFNYRQKIEFVLESNGSEVTSATFSSDAVHLAVGSANGDIRVYDLTTKQNNGVFVPYTISPISIQERFTKNLEGHLGIPITSLQFVGNANLVSVDTSGLVFLHHGFTKFMKKHFITSKLLGKNDANSPEKSFVIHGCEVLPMGTSEQITDGLGMVALMTSSALQIVSVMSLNDSKNVNLVSRYRAGRSRHVEGDIVASCMNWYPCMKHETGVSNARLVYSWNNVLTVLELNNRVLPGNLASVIDELKDKDKGVPPLSIEKTCRWRTSSGSERIVSAKWITSSLLFVFITRDDEHLHLKALYYQSHGSLELKGSLSQVQIDQNLELKVHTTPRDWAIKCFKQRLVVMVNSRIFMGHLLNWADILVGLLKQGLYAKALVTASEFYENSSTGSLALIGLPIDMKKRASLLDPYLFQILKEAVHPIFGSSDHDNPFYLGLYLRLVAQLWESHGAELTGVLNDLFECYQDHSELFESLQPYILSGQIVTLAPTILNELVKTYVESGRGLVLTEILCVLDISSLNIDLTIQLCKKHALTECLIYIWTYVLHDYQTPLVDFISDFSAPGFAPNNNHLQAYTFMSYVLTGRQYPTDNFIAYDMENKAKDQICTLLFSSSCINWPPNSASVLGSSDVVFPYLYVFLRANSFEMLGCLNEFFEDSWLNDSEGGHLTRQYIIDALLDIFDTNEFEPYDNTQLAIFIGRNYSKYTQFIRLSESILHRVVDSLCANTDPGCKTDCELALQSLLPYYEPYNDDFFMEKLRLCQYWDVLNDIYVSQGKYSQVLEVWFRKLESTWDASSGLGDVLEKSFSMTKNPADRTSLVRFIKTNFEKLARVNLDVLLEVVNENCVGLTTEVLSFDDDLLALDYLTKWFSTAKPHTQDFDAVKSGVGCRYVELLCTYQPADVHQFVKEWKAEVTGWKGSVLEVLEHHQQVEALAEVHVYLKKYHAGLQAILQYMKANKSSLDDTTVKTRFTRLLRQAMDICEEPGTAQQYDQDLSLNEYMWLELIGTFIEMSSDASDASDPESSVFFNRCIHECFRDISDSKLNPGDRKEDSFLRIFHQILTSPTSTTTPATLANIRDILQEVFVSYSYESEMLEISLRMLNSHIYKNMTIVRANNVKGWVPSKACSSCDKPMWGAGIPEIHYQAWERRQVADLFDHGSKYGRPRKEETDGHLVLFKCGHGYHYGCIGWGEMVCVICTTNEQ